MGNVARLDDYRKKAVQEHRVADLDDGYTRIANDLLEAITQSDLTLRQIKVALAVIRKTYGYGKKLDWIGNKQLSELTGLPETRCSTVKNELIQMNILVSNGRQIGINKDISQWDFSLYQNSKTFTKSVKKSFTKTVNHSLPKEVNTKETITKESKENTPNPLNGVCEGEIKKSKKTQIKIDYQAVMDAYNSAVGDRLPNAESLNDKRKRAIKRLLSELKEPTVTAASAYFKAFISEAKPFYFGENTTGWTANFDYVLRSDTLTKTREGAL